MRSLRLLMLLPLLLVVEGAVHFLKPHFETVTLSDASRAARIISLPFQAAHDPKDRSHRYRIHAEFQLYKFGQTTFRFVAQKCVKSLAVNGRPVDVSHLDACNFRTGFSYPLGNLLRSGSNTIDLEIEGTAEKVGLRIDESVRDPLFLILRLWELVILSLLVIFGLRRFLRHDIDTRLLVVASVSLILGVVFRYNYILYVHPPIDSLYSDPAHYVEIAKEWLQGQFRLTQTLRGAGLPILIYLTLKLTSGSWTAVTWVQFLLSVAGFLLSWRAIAVLCGEAMGAISLVFFSFHFSWIAMSAFFMPEAADIFLNALLFYLLVKKTFPWKPLDALALGVLYMLGGWFKGTNLFFWPLLLLWIAAEAFQAFKRKEKDLLVSIRRSALYFSFGSFILLACYGVFNRRLYGIHNLTSTNGGLNFVEGKCPEKDNIDLDGYRFLSPLFYQLEEKAVKRWNYHFYDDKAFFRAGLNCIRENPAVLISSFRYIYYLFFGNELWPNGDIGFDRRLAQWDQIFLGFFVVPGFIIGLLLLTPNFWDKSRIPFLMLFSLLFTAWLFKSELRYRISFDMVIFALSLLGWRETLTKLFSPRQVRRFACAVLFILLFMAADIAWQLADVL